MRFFPNAPGAFTYQYKDSDLRGNDGAEPAVSQHLSCLKQTRPGSHEPGLQAGWIHESPENINGTDPGQDRDR